MKDRVPLYPGRVTLTPVSGQANTFDLVRADQPTQEGTPLNKASLLKDATAALYGLPNTAVPDDVLSKIKTLIDSANANANTKARIATGSYTGTGTYGSNNPNSLTFEFEPKLVFIGPTTEYVQSGLMAILMNPSTRGIALYDYVKSLDVQMWGKTVSWFGSDQYLQMNKSRTEYTYFAIG